MMRTKVTALLLGSLALFLAADVLGQGCPPPNNLPIGTCAPASGTVSNFTGDTGPMRTRKSIYRLTAAEVTELKLAFQRLRALPSTDPRRWIAQANVHCWYCAGGATTVPDVHSNWAFLPWHRVYLYNLEKTLGTLVNNPNFALPYWDWNTADSAVCGMDHLKVPAPYMGGDASTNSLFDCYRNVTTSSSMNVNSVGPARINTILTNNNTFSLFFGTATSSSAVSPGPHGYVHLWVGNSTNLGVAKQDMGVLETAARDPLFWAHHANIDRLWEMWIARYGTPTYPQAFQDQNWLFWNQNRVRTRMRGSDAVARATRLRYQYAAPCLSIVNPNITAAIDRITLTPVPMTVRTTPVITESTDMEEAPQPPPRETREFNINGDVGRNVVLHLEEVEVPADESAILRVYVNQPDATAESVTDESVAGTGRLVEELYIVPARTPGTGHGGHAAHKYHFKIALPPDIAAEVERAKGDAQVTIVPVASENGILESVPRAVNVKMRKPYITVE